MTDDLRAARTLTQKDLDDAPVGIVVRAADGTIAARYDRQRGVIFGDDRPFPWSVLRAPAVVLWPRDECIDAEYLERRSEWSARAWPDWRGRSEDEAIDHERKPRCYIAGPIAGVPDFRERFAAAVSAVEALGYEAVNPCDIPPVDHEGECPPGYDPGEDASGHTSSACFMRADLHALLGCDAIFMLPGWRESRGATVEHAVAVACGIPVLDEKEGNPNEQNRR